GKQGQTQSTDANNLFTEGDPVVPIDPTSITLLDESGQPATEVPAKDADGNVVGNYVLNSVGTVTFTPNPDFVGTPVPVTIQAKDANGTPVTTTYTPTVTPVTPTATAEITNGKQGQTQSTDANSLFTEGDPVAPIDPTSITLLDESGQPATEVPAKDSKGNVVGNYVLNSDGTVTFTPNPDFVGTPVPVTVQAKDANGTPVTTTYTPTVTPVTPTAVPETTNGLQGQTQSTDTNILFTEGDSVAPIDSSSITLLDESGNPVTEVPAKDSNGNVIGSYVLNSDGTITFTPKPSFVGTAVPVEIQAQDSNGTIVRTLYTPVVTPVFPTSTPSTTKDKQGQTQTTDADSLFKAGDEVVPIDSTSITLLDETGQPTKEVPAKDENGNIVGSFVLKEDGTIIFTPNLDFVGTPVPVTIQAKDTNGTAVTTTYTPTVTPVTPNSKFAYTIDKQGQTQAADTNTLFVAGDEVVPIDPTSITLLDESGQPAFEVPAKDSNGNIIGSYVLNPDGTITFTPNPDFVGTAVPVTVQAKDTNGTIVRSLYTPTVTPITPTADPGITNGKQGQTQTTDANILFKEGDSVAPIDASSITLLDESGQPATEVPAKDAEGNVVGNYVLNSDGTVTFTPNPDFVGTPVPVTIQAKDANGTPVTTTYTPTVTPVTPTADPGITNGKQGQTQTTDANVLFKEGDSVAPIDVTSITLLDESGQPATEVPAKDSKGNVVGNYVHNSDGTVTFTPNPDFVGTPVPVTVQAKDANGTPVTTTYTPTVTPITPTADPGITNGKQGQTQSADANSFFTEGDSVAPIDVTSITLLDESGQPATEVPAKDSKGNVVGNYVLNSDGTVTFTPNPDFVGTPVPVTIQAKDANGTAVTTTYTPTVTPVTPTADPEISKGKQGQTQSIDANGLFTEGDSVAPIDASSIILLDESGQPATEVPAKDAEGNVVGNYVLNTDGTVTFTPNPDFVGTPVPVTIQAKDANGTPVTTTYTPTVTPVTPTADPESTEGKQGQIQTTDATVLFTEGDSVAPIDLTSITLLDESGQPATEVLAKDLNGNVIGSYVLNPDGTITFTPNPDFVGTPVPVRVQAKDANGTAVITTYTPTVLPVKEVTTEWVDENGNPLKDPTTGETPSEAGTIDGYEFVGTTTDENGNVKHVFKKVVTPVKEVTTEWVDENGNPLKDPTTGETPSEAGTIDGYEFVGTTTDENGNVKHVFKKVVTPVKEVTTEWVDENGNPLK
ncbi:TPA: hypothetical protein TXJ05_002312, partial [Streptococcus suis]|nr:hypothetical protein [Streptococcus suis]